MKYQVHIPASGHRFTVNDQQTILEAALASNIALPYGCRGGRCCACEGRVLKGEIRYDQPPAGLTNNMQDDGKALFCQARACSDLEIAIDEIEQSDQIKVMNIPTKVARIEPLSHDVMQVFLKLPEAIRLQFFAGQYIDIIQDNGEHRSFSIANAPHDDDFIELHIRLIDGGEYTRYIFEKLKVGEILRIEAPLGSFYIRENSQRPIIMIGGGTGFAPLKGILEYAFHAQIERPMHLFWGVRSKRDLYLPDLPVKWTRKHPLFRFTPVLSEPQAEDDWRGETGFVHEVAFKHYPDMLNMDIYLSGPPAMVYAARDTLLERGLSQTQLYSDAFEFNSQMDKAAGED